MINVQLSLYIVSFYPGHINALIDNTTGCVPSCNIVTDTSVDYQLYALLKNYTKEIPEQYANFRLVDLSTINDKLTVSYLTMVNSNTKFSDSGKNVSIETLLNENTYKIIQKIKNII